jgi:hypothetical protein
MTTAKRNLLGQRPLSGCSLLSCSSPLEGGAFVQNTQFSMNPKKWFHSLLKDHAWGETALPRELDGEGALKPWSPMSLS